MIPSVFGQGYYPITGVDVDPRASGVPLRQNINDIYAQGGPQWDLYIQALMAMYNTNSSNDLSYFQISGIHGRPYREWNGGGSRRSDGWLGYCPHMEPLFLPWHRPYVLLFEQVLVGHARRIASQYPSRYRHDYTQAADRLRAPYWDWADNDDVPPATVPQRVRINVVSGTRLRQVEVDNPLASYRFSRDVTNGNFGTFETGGRNMTYRCPSPRSYPYDANRNMGRRPYKQWTYDAFTVSRNFSEFSSSGESGVSLEQIHNAVHWDAGCGGMFLNADYSAFDPLFMLHHTNVDRLWAYWQAIRPEHSLFRRTYSGGSRYSTPGGSSISPRSPLNPFFRRNGEFHTSESVESIQGLGYTYQGLEYWYKTPEQMGQDSRRLINRLYAPSNSSQNSVMRRDEQSTRFFISVSLDVTEVERPCSIEVSLNGQMAGSLVVMGQPDKGTFHGSFGLDEALQSQEMNEMTVEDAAKMIQTGIVVEITKVDGSKIPIATVPSLSVDLEDMTVTPASTEDELPRYGVPRLRPAGPLIMGEAARLRKLRSKIKHWLGQS
ncbi:hypothetical protein B0I35DRAFT_356410 [Stachybotrys elegans]|uniref:tyrosinase n=1 Tax=Stachybotrys elegans TaxID=80388 RepID=A0A8K0SN24_9HYPO|nr:hypothetical protein B0I35DRAFT_356410 [Stachybotrys elegans]